MSEEDCVMKHFKHTIKRIGVACMSLLLLAFVGSVQAATVEVTWDKPEEFTDIESTYVGYNGQFRQVYLDRLERHFQRLASMHLDDDHTLYIDVSDIDRAGRVEPATGPDSEYERVVMPNDVPKMTLSFRLEDGEGSTVKQGEDLRIEGSLTRPEGQGRFPRLNRTDRDMIAPEARMINRWFLQTFLSD